ncbi:sporulenol synthase [Evansella vedderi]|uniref:Sporulenol synthase n=1 Tax=Evansella vedderi TaxID=38282 RepID=A0ABU0A1S3_9BACI|nr:prenyltransferase/squalene oxidase repeat-containing protein [Evansella vedderi]MDQ0257430.1 sporulenol synthase [Evansella vedderi]
MDGNYSIEEKLKSYQLNKIYELKAAQHPDGTWRFPCENGPMTDAYMIIILRTLNITKEETFIKKLTNRLLATQSTNGSWKLYKDEKEGNLSATVEAYTALLFSGYAHKDDENIKRAETFILRKGGLKKSHVFTKFMLALNGLYPWPTIFPIPLSLLWLPRFSPVNFYDLTSYVKTHFAAVLIAAHHRFSIRCRNTPNLMHLIKENKVKKRLQRQQKATNSKGNPLNFFLKRMKQKGIRRAEKYLIDRVEADGTLGSYASATFLMIYSLLAIGYSPESQMVQRAIEGTKRLAAEVNSLIHIQNAASTLWDTSLIAYALDRTGEAASRLSVKKGASYLVERQQLFQRGSMLFGTWGFSENNSFHPDVDDTQAALRVMAPFIFFRKKYKRAWKMGVDWLLAMQKRNGGWGSFEQKEPRRWITMLPIENIKDTAIDPATADLTGRTLEFLGTYVKMNKGNKKIDAAINWLLKNQEKNGSWYGRWGVCYIYGTWAAVTGLRAVGVPADHPAVVRAKNWLLSIQNNDGSWGESCSSDIKKTFIPLGEGTPTHTAWALDALISIEAEPTPEIQKGMEFLLEERGDRNYPTGGGLPGNFYINYHSYKVIWPLLTLSNYANKYLKK